MIASMTGFARREQAGSWGTLTCELRSVNHRYLEPGFRLKAAVDREASCEGCSFRAGAGVTVTPSGGLQLHASDFWPLGASGAPASSAVIRARQFGG